MPFSFSKLNTSESRNKAVNFLKYFKSMIILSNNIRYISFILFALKDQEL
jgi:hypothetical protein